MTEYPDNHGLDLVRPPVYAFAVDALQQGAEPADAMKLMMTAGLAHVAARALLTDALAEASGQDSHAFQKLAESLHGDSSLEDVKAQGYNTDGWKKWQQGGCLEYAVGLTRLNPKLRFGTLVNHEDGPTGETYDIPTHHFAHDDSHAYDSSGKHPLPYHGVTGHADAAYLDDDPDDYDQAHEDDVHEAMEHAKAHGILEGRYGPHVQKRAKSHQQGPSVAGVALKAHDTGRVLMLQRGNEDKKDPARGTWEFPGGHMEEGDTTTLHGAIREWEEEVGQQFPEGGAVTHTWTSPNGVYQGHVVVIPRERDLVMHNGRVVPNPDDPKGDKAEQAAWWEVDHARKNPALRSELKSGTPWKQIKDAALPGAEKTATYTAYDGLGEFSPPYEKPQHVETDNPASSGFATSEDPPEWDHNLNQRDDLMASYAVLHDEPEPALPSTDGGENDIVESLPVDGADGLLDGSNPSINSQDVTGAERMAPINPHAHIPYDDREAMQHGYDDLTEFREDHPEAAPGSGSLNPSPVHGSRSVEDTIAWFQRTAAAQSLASNSVNNGHTQEDQMDIASAARDFLERRTASAGAGQPKTALKTFTPSEQQALINEGAGSSVTARNIGDLRTEGTHYHALEAAMGAGEIDPDDLFI